MTYVIVTRDKEMAIAQPIRDKYRAEHYEYLEKNKRLIRESGGMINERGEPLGGVIILETDDLSEAEQLSKNDPFTKAGLFEWVTITKFRHGYFNHERVKS